MSLPTADFLAAALNLKIGNHYPEQGMDEIPASATLRRGDDYVRGADVYRQKCAMSWSSRTWSDVQRRVLLPGLGRPELFSLDSRMNFAKVNTVMSGFICRNMPLGEEGSLENQECRDIAYYVGLCLGRPVIGRSAGGRMAAIDDDGNARPDAIRGGARTRHAACSSISV